MDDLIEALQIFRVYSNEKWPTICEHDVLYIVGIEPAKVSPEHTKRLEELGFIISSDPEDCFKSYRFGSA